MGTITKIFLAMEQLTLIMLMESSHVLDHLQNEIENNEENTAKVIVETIIEKKLSHYDIPEF